MTPRETVMEAFAHRPTQKLAKWLGASPEFIALAAEALGLAGEEELRLRLGDDFRRVGSRWAGPERQLSPGATWVSPFGVERTGLFYGEPMTHPLAGKTAMADLEAYPWPDPSWADVSGIRSAALSYAGRFAILGGEWSPFWHDAIDLVGMENLYYLMYDDPTYVDALMARINGYYLAASERAFQVAGDCMDIYFIGNDFGGQTGPLLGPELFTRFMQPLLKAHAELAHSYGLKLMLHCCGGFRPLIPAMIEAGLDGLHALQPDCAGMEARALKRDFGQRLVLNGGIDSKAALIQGTPELAREATLAAIEALSPGGAYIAGASHDFILPETPVGNVVAMFDAIQDYQLS
jgi:uroporphyrinogen decarboxylase